MDGHDKLMGYQNSTFPLAMYDSIDTASRESFWLKIWTGNSDPKRIARWYLEHLYETRTAASHIRIDKGSETGNMTTMHSYLRQTNFCHESLGHRNIWAIYFAPGMSLFQKNEIRNFTVSRKFVMYHNFCPANR